jgi:hypothetical protein
MATQSRPASAGQSRQLPDQGPAEAGFGRPRPAWLAGKLDGQRQPYHDDLGACIRIRPVWDMVRCAKMMDLPSKPYQGGTPQRLPMRGQPAEAGLGGCSTEEPQPADGC